MSGSTSSTRRDGANGGQGANVPPTDPNAIAPFLRFMTARQPARGVEAFEIWNEQDTSRL